METPEEQDAGLRAGAEALRQLAAHKKLGGIQHFLPRRYLEYTRDLLASLLAMPSEAYTFGAQQAILDRQLRTQVEFAYFHRPLAPSNNVNVADWDGLRFYAAHIADVTATLASDDAKALTLASPRDYLAQNPAFQLQPEATQAALLAGALRYFRRQPDGTVVPVTRHELTLAYVAPAPARIHELRAEVDSIAPVNGRQTGNRWPVPLLRALAALYAPLLVVDAANQHRLPQPTAPWTPGQEAVLEACVRFGLER